MRGLLKHRHPSYPEGLCQFTCPVWQADDLRERRALYASRRELEALLEDHLRARGHVEGLRRLRVLQRERPNLWPRVWTATRMSTI